MKVIVTGARGYIGSELLPCLKSRGHEVVGLSRSPEHGKYVCVTTGVTGTLEQHMDAAAAVVHLAGKLVENRAARIEEYLEANVVFTDEVMYAAAEAGVQSVVHASSRLVYPTTLNAPAHESDALPDTPYGMSKLWAEDLVRDYCHRSGMSGVSLRLGQVTGGNHPGLGVINTFVRQARDTGAIRVSGAGLAQRDIIHVRDVAEALIAGLNYRGKWRALNIGGLEPSTIVGLAETVQQVAGRDQVHIVHEEVAVEDTSCFALRSEAAREYLEWSPTVETVEIVTEAWKEWKSK